MEHTAKIYADHFTQEETAAFKTKRIADLTTEALDLLSRAEYLEHARLDIVATRDENVAQAQPLEEELAEILKTDKLNKTQRERRKELERALIPLRKKISNLTDDAAGFEINAEKTRDQATERIYRRDYLKENFEKALALPSPDPRMKKPTEAEPIAAVITPVDPEAS